MLSRSNGKRPRRQAACGSILGALVLIPGALAADTVRLRTGGLVPDCRILGEEGGKVLLVKPGGRMGIPREVIAAIERGPSVFDEFDTRRAKVKESDLIGMLELARWCREASLHEEAHDLLEKLLARSPGLQQARRLAGHALVEGSWRKLPPLVLKVVPGGEKEMGEEVLRQMSIVLAVRKDLQAREELKGVEEKDALTLEVGVATSTVPEARFYGQEIRGPAARAGITLRPVGRWMGEKAPTLALEGEAPAGLPGAPRVALMDGFGRGCREVHAFLDKLLEERVRLLEKPPAKDGKKTGAKKGTVKTKGASPGKKGTGGKKPTSGK